MPGQSQGSKICQNYDNISSISLAELFMSKIADAGQTSQFKKIIMQSVVKLFDKLESV